MDMTVRRTEPGDYEAMQRIFGGSRAVAGTKQMPLPSAERWRRRLAEPQEGLFSLVVCVVGEVVGSLGLEASTRYSMARVVNRVSGSQHAFFGRFQHVPACKASTFSTLRPSAFPSHVIPAKAGIHRQCRR